jgi:hypothetical protein
VRLALGDLGTLVALGVRSQPYIASADRIRHERDIALEAASATMSAGVSTSSALFRSSDDGLYQVTHGECTVRQPCLRVQALVSMSDSVSGGGASVARFTT